jgi:hypothetical protein
MSLLDVIGGGIGTIVETIAKPFTVAQERKKEVAVRDKEIEKIQAEALVEAAKQGQITQADWDNVALKNSEKSYKDEFLMFLMYFPVAALFFTSIFMPEKVADVKLAVTSLEDFPMWYQILLWGILAHVFGLRWLVEPLVTMMKNKQKQN